MNIDERKILGLSFAVSLVFHILIFSVFYFLNFKPLKEKEKIITVSLDLPPVEEKASAREKKEPVKTYTEPQEKILEKAQPQKQTFTPKKPQPMTEPPSAPEKTLPSPQPTPQQPSQESTQQFQPSQQAQQPIPTQHSSTSQPAPTQPQTQQKIDLTAGRQEQLKPPPKKDEDIDGYLKELIRYLNQQARERDLYPPIAKRLKIEGQVVVRVTINEDGTIEEGSMMVVESSGYNVLDKGALDILKKLQPLKKPPKKITVEIPIVFQIIYM